MKSQEELIAHITKELQKDVKVKVAAVDIDGVLRGKIIQKSKFLSILKDGFGMCTDWLTLYVSNRDMYSNNVASYGTSNNSTNLLV
jgi:hypothetical protein